MKTDAERIQELEDLLRNFAMEIFSVVDPAAVTAINQLNAIREANARRREESPYCQHTEFKKGFLYGCDRPKGHTGRHFCERLVDE